MDQPSHKSLHELLDAEEGYSKKIYLDTNGVLTGGRGHAFMEGSTLPDFIWELIFDHDLSEAQRKFDLLNLGHLSERRRWVCVAMIFQLGFGGFKGFERTIRFLRQENYKDAATEMLDSVWAKNDTPERALRMSEMMLVG